MILIVPRLISEREQINRRRCNIEFVKKIDFVTKIYAEPIRRGSQTKTTCQSVCCAIGTMCQHGAFSKYLLDSADPLVLGIQTHVEFGDVCVDDSSWCHHAGVMGNSFIDSIGHELESHPGMLNQSILFSQSFSAFESCRPPRFQEPSLLIANSSGSPDRPPCDSPGSRLYG